MIEITIRNYLNNALEVPAYLAYPEGENMPQRYVMIEKVGAGRRDHINSATLALQSYGESLWEAMQLNEAVKEAMDACVTMGEIASAKLNSDYNFTDTERKKYRYQAVYNITHY